MAGLKPGMGRSVGVSAEVTVSPICVSAMSLMEAVNQPTSPTPSPVLTFGSGLKKPTLSTSNVFPVETTLILSFALMAPSNTLMKAMTPW